MEEGLIIGSLDNIIRHEEDGYVCTSFGTKCPFNGKRLMNKIQFMGKFLDLALDWISYALAITEQKPVCLPISSCKIACQLSETSK